MFGLNVANIAVPVIAKTWHIWDSTLSTRFLLSLCPSWTMFYYLSVEPNLNCIFGGEQLVAKKSCPLIQSIS